MTPSELAGRQLAPAKTPLMRREIAGYLREVPGWRLEGNRLNRIFSFPGSAPAIEFLSSTLLFCLQEGHVPDIALSAGRHVEVSWYTYEAGGLTADDFIMAAKLDARGVEKK
jgi:4a-hydroxytetrahydrobiopterin dehydratase